MKLRFLTSAAIAAGLLCYDFHEICVTPFHSSRNYLCVLRETENTFGTVWVPQWLVLTKLEYAYARFASFCWPILFISAQNFCTAKQI